MQQNLNCIEMRKTPLKKKGSALPILPVFLISFTNTSTSLPTLRCFQMHSSVLFLWAFLQATAKLKEKHLQ